MTQYIVEYVRKGQVGLYSVTYQHIEDAIACFQKMVASDKYSEVHISAFLF